jgi:hypothetical protein
MDLGLEPLTSRVTQVALDALAVDMMAVDTNDGL